MLADDLDRVWLVELDADNGFLCAEFLPHHLGALEQGVGSLDHQPVVVGKVGLALGAVDQ